MAEFPESFVLTAFLNDAVANHVFKDDVNDGSIGPNCTDVRTSSTDGTPANTTVSVVFDAQISGAEQTILDGKVAAHDGVVPIIGTGAALTVPTGDFSTEQSIWTKVTDGVVIFPGTDLVTVSGAKISAYMDTGPTDYDLQVLDITHESAVIASLLGETELVPMTFTDLIPITNLPTGAACFELQVRRNGGGAGEKVYVEAWMLVLN